MNMSIVVVTLSSGWICSRHAYTRRIVDGLLLRRILFTILFLLTISSFDISPRVLSVISIIVGRKMFCIVRFFVTLINMSGIFES